MSKNASTSNEPRILPDLSAASNAPSAASDALNETSASPTAGEAPSTLANLLGQFESLAKASGKTVAEILGLTSPQAVKANIYEAKPGAYKNGVPLSARVTYIAPNPKKPGSNAYARYANYPTLVEGSTWTLEKILKEIPNGPRTDDFLYDIRKGFIKVEL